MLRFRKPNIVFITGDRPEMVVAAMVAFHMNIPIAHYYAGILNPEFMTHDTIDRHCITLWSDIQFVESEVCKVNVEMLLASIKKEVNCKVVGISHLENMQLDESLVPEYSYNLILYNIPSKNKEQIEYVIDFVKQFNIAPIIWIGSNPDGDNIAMKKAAKQMLNVKWYDEVPRNQYLGLLKNCHQFVSNSSDIHYIAPHFLKQKQIISIGNRNKRRTSGLYNNLDGKASVKIRKYLEYWRSNKNE